MKLEYPLSDALPSIEHARDRLLARLFHYRKDHEASRLSMDEDYALLYAFSKPTDPMHSLTRCLWIMTLVDNL
jgi:hypothetical protein